MCLCTSNVLDSMPRVKSGGNRLCYVVGFMIGIGFMTSHLHRRGDRCLLYVYVLEIQQKPKSDDVTS